MDHPYGTTVPFAIQWPEGAPPWSLEPSPTCRIDDFHVGHADPDGLERVLRLLGSDVPVHEAPEPTLAAALVGPAGDARFASR